MDYKIITDTSCDLSKEMARDLNITYVPFYISISQLGDLNRHFLE